jgi:hypothetical protein
MLVRYRSAERRAAADVEIGEGSDELIGALSGGPQAVTFTSDDGADPTFDSTVHAIVVDGDGVAHAMLAPVVPAPVT